MSLTKRIMTSYEADEEQQRVIQEVLDDELGQHDAAMGQAKVEVDELRQRKIDRLREYATQLADAQKRAKNGEVVELALPPVDEDPVLRDLHNRITVIEESYPIDWSRIADRIERKLPPAQAERGRLRLSETMPHRFSSRARQVREDGKTKSLSSTHPWDEYVRQFVTRYSLDAGQADSARSILAELKDKDLQMRESVLREAESAPSEADQAVAEARRESYEDARDELFKELQRRLDGLLGIEQRERSPDDR